jgi:hypothetical protein
MGMRSKLAVEWSAEAIAKNGGSFWTFTLPKALDLNEQMRIWTKFSERITKLNAKTGQEQFSGLKVMEWHPGQDGEGSHGVHWHVVCPTSYKISVILPIWLACGGGRIGVYRIVPDEVYKSIAAKLARRGETPKTIMPTSKVGYVAKYLSRKKQPPCFRLHRVRVWSVIGKAARAAATRVKDIQCKSTWGDSWAFVARTVEGFSNKGWWWRVEAVRRWHTSSNFVEWIIGTNCHHFRREDTIPF